MGKSSRYLRKQFKIKLLKQFNNRCPYCFCLMKPSGNEIKNAGPVATLDHIIARAAGGNNKQENLLICCATCNNHKGNRSLIVYLKSKRLQKIFDQNLTKALRRQEKLHG